MYFIYSIRNIVSFCKRDNFSIDVEILFLANRLNLKDITLGYNILRGVSVLKPDDVRQVFVLALYNDECSVILNE